MVPGVRAYTGTYMPSTAGLGGGRDHRRPLGCLEGVMAKEERGLAAQQALRLPSPFGWVNVTAEVILGSGQR